MAKIEAIALLAQINGGSTLAEVAALAVDALSQADLPPLVKWSVPATARRKKASSEGWPDEINQPHVDTATLELDDGSLGSLFHPHGKKEWSFALDLLAPKNSPAAVPQLLAAQRGVARTLLADAHVIKVIVSMQSAGAYCLPEVPIALTRSYLVSCTNNEVAESYENPKQFWNSGWQATEWIGERAILERAMRTTDTVEYLREVIPHQWTLARATKPGQCSYGIPAVWPEEQVVYSSGASALQEVGYEDATSMAELSCALRPPAHVQGREIFNIYALLQTGRLPDGRPLKGVRVVFLHEAMARAERRPLLDVGAQVFYYDADGILRELGE